jgi:hypothetical protein
MIPNRRTIAPILAISIAFALLISPVAIVASADLPDSSSDQINSNISQGSITLFSQNYSDYRSVPSNVFVSMETSPQLWNAEVGYNYDKNALDFSVDRGEGGYLYIAGLIPMEVTTYHLEIGMVSSSWLSESHIRFAGGAFTYQIDGRGNRIIESSDGGISMNLGHSRDNKIAIDIILDSKLDTYRIKYSESKFIDLPWSAYRQSVPFDTFTGTFLSLDSYVCSYDTTVSTLIYNITQTAPRLYVTPLGATGLTAFGLDHGRYLSTVQNGVAAITNAGGSGTIWFDVGHDFMGDDTELAFYLDLITNHGWEVGIHFSSQLTSMTMNDATALMQSEYNQITSRLGVSPKTWCCLTGAENITHVIWAYYNLGMICRDDDVGVQMLNCVGNLWTDTMPWWMSATAAGLVMPAFTHETDINPPIPYSLNLIDFKKWVDGYTTSGIKITSFYDWYMTNLNTGDAQATNVISNGQAASFTMSTNGARCYTNVNYHATISTVISDQSTGPITYTVEPDGSISFWTENGHSYTIVSESSQPTLPSAPRNLIATAGNAQATLTWSAPSSNGGADVTAYNVYRGTGSGGASYLTTVGKVLTYTNTGLTNGVTYYYNVTAVNSVGAGPSSNEASAKPAAPSGITPKFTITNVSGTYIAKNAAGDTVYSGTNAATVINSALNGLTSGRVTKEKVLMSGMFTLTSSIVMPSHAILELNGTAILSAPTVAYMIDAVGKTSLEVSGGTWDSGVATYPVMGFDTCTDINVHNCAVRNGGDGLQIYEVMSGLIANNTITNTKNNAIAILYSCSGIRITGNHATDCVGGIMLYTPSDASVQVIDAIRIDNNTLSRISGDGINLYPAGAEDTISNVVVDTNTLSDCGINGYGMAIAVGIAGGSGTPGLTTNSRIIKNSVSCTGAYSDSGGIWVRGTYNLLDSNSISHTYGPAMGIDAGSNNILSNNIINTVGLGWANGIYVSGSSNHITGNHITNIPNYCIYAAAGSSGNQIINNTLQAPRTISDHGTGNTISPNTYV